MKRKGSKNLSWIASCAFHGILIGCLFLTLEHTVIVTPNSSNEENKEIIEAVMINKESLQKEVDRLDNIERRKKAEEQRKIEEAKLKRQKEEEKLAQLKAKNEQLKKEAEQQKIAKVKEEKKRQEKLKAEKEELKKLKKEKEAALAAKQEAEESTAKKKAEVEQEVAKSVKVDPNLINQHGLLIVKEMYKHWRQPMGMNINGLRCQVAVRLMPTGDVIEVKIVKSSGSVEYDRSAELAIRKASPLPMPSDASIAKEFKDFDFTFDPEAA